MDRPKGSKESRPGVAEIDKSVEQSVTRDVDVDALSRPVLGEHWIRTGAEQRSGFVAVFRRLVVRTYPAALKDSQGTNTRVPAPGDTGASVP
jgi:ABC-type transporter MlaC component